MADLLAENYLFPEVGERVAGHLRTRLTKDTAAQAINPITGKKWQSAGVIPDIEMPAEHALYLWCSFPRT